MRSITYYFILCFSFFFVSLDGQSSQVEFGKNRVQYHQDFSEWMRYESENFITYWYGEGRNIGQAVVQIAELDFSEIQNILEHRMNNKIEIIVYKDVTDIKQSNIGSEEAFINTGGRTKIVGSKVFVYFDGNHNHLRQALREGIASVYMNAMMFGSNLQEIVQNAVMLNLPKWFKIGLVSYVGQDWSTELDNELRDIILNEKYKNFDAFAEARPKLAGHSMWYFISQNYGKSTVSNLLYLTRINRSVESGFLYVLGTPYKRTIDNWSQYFLQRYKVETVGMQDFGDQSIKIKNRRKLPISKLKLSPDGRKIAYVLNEIGKVKVYIQDLQTNDRQVILKYGSRNAFQETDYNYPLLAWNPNNMELGIIYEKRDIIKSLFYDLTTKEKVDDIIPNQFQRIYSMDYINPAKLVFSAAVRGASDIYTYVPANRQSVRLTNDFWDDLDASYVNVHGQKGILFASNRQDSMLVKAKLDSILPINTFDIYYYDLENKSQELVRITHTENANERYPVGLDSTWFAYTSDQSGIKNRQIGFLEEYIAFHEQVITLTDGTEIILHQDSSLKSLDSTLIETIVLQPVYKKRAVTHNTTNYSRNIIYQHSAPRSKKMVELVKTNGIPSVYIREIDTTLQIYSKLTRHREQMIIAANTGLSSSFLQIPLSPTETTPNKTEDSKTNNPEDEIDIDNYLFQSEFDDDEAPPTIVIEGKEGKIIITEPTMHSVANYNQEIPHKFRPARIVPYRLKFRTDFVTTQLDNGLLFEGLNNYAGEIQDYNYPPPGILLKANFKDLFEDYILEGGIRVPTTFNGAEYFLYLDDKKKRLDKRYALYRKSQKNIGLPGTSFVPPQNRQTTFLMQLGLRYPLDIFTSIRGTTTLRFDKQTQLATDRNTLNTPTAKQQRLGFKLEYVYDNTLDVDINIKHGTRYKFFAEVVKRFEIDLIDGFNFNLNKGFMTVLGADARHYQRLDKHSIFAVRFAAATSFGSERMLFIMGAVDNKILPVRFNDEIPLPSSDGYAYQTFANNLRGFHSNIRNGTSYALVNTELRVPIFKYIFRRVRSSFFRNFQLVGFFDFGTAWQGFSPYDEDNPLNITTISNNVVTVDVNYFRDPIVAGYGAGIRTVLFGYFLRLDYGWGIETKVVQDPILYFSMGMDF